MKMIEKMMLEGVEVQAQGIGCWSDFECLVLGDVVPMRFDGKLRTRAMVFHQEDDWLGNKSYYFIERWSDGRFFEYKCYPNSIDIADDGAVIEPRLLSCENFVSGKVDDERRLELNKLIETAKKVWAVKEKK